ncbi:MAG: LysR family transcriptional regulator [Polyangiaceae bacterium]|nr:LysR family transcriptional regulator [Polyangiaceae bacterium]
MDLEELSAFLKVVDAGSFLAAADSLGVSRSTLRRRVGALEARAGVPLLESTSTGVVLTEAGRVLRNRGKTMIEEASALIASVREVGNEPAGTLRVIMPVGLPPHLLTPLLALFRERFPRLGTHLRFSSDPLSESIVDVDIVVHFADDAPTGPYISYAVFRVRQWLVASKEYLDKRGTPTSLEELRRHELLAWQAPFEDPCVWPTLQGATFVVQPALIATDIHFLRRCCMEHLGIGLVPDAKVTDPSLVQDTLVPVMPDLVGRDRTLRMSVPKALAEVPKIKVVLEQARHFLQGL